MRGGASVTWCFPDAFITSPRGNSGCVLHLMAAMLTANRQIKRLCWSKEYADANDSREVPKGRFLVEINMKFALKSIVAAAAFVAVGAASAATVTVTTGNTFSYQGTTLTATGTGTLSFSSALLGGLDAVYATVDAYTSNSVYTATSTSTFDADGNFATASASAQITGLTIDDTTNAVQVAQTSGGALITALKTRGASNGGTLVVTDLKVDLVAGKVYGTLIGGNGYGTVSFDGSTGSNYLWDISSITGATAVTGAGTYTTTITGLSISAAAKAAFIQSLGLISNGITVMDGITDYGSIVSVITATVAAVPEPSTYALMGLGLVGLSLVARRRAK